MQNQMSPTFKTPFGKLRVAEDGLLEGVTEILASLSAVVHRVDGRPDEDLGVICRRIVSSAFLQVVTHAMVGTGADVTRIQAYNFHEWGNDTTAENASQSACIAKVGTQYGAENSSQLDAGTPGHSASTYYTAATLVATGNYTISEHCVHPTNASPSDAYGLDRSKFTGVSLGSGDSITFTYTLSLSGS